MADDIILAAPAPTHTPLTHTPLTPSWQGGKMTNTEAKQLVSKLRGWARQFNHDEARVLDGTLEDVERCFVCVWTEIDEALTRLMLMERDPSNAAEHLAVAKMYLHRWQDRGGRVGNVG